MFASIVSAPFSRIHILRSARLTRTFIQFGFLRMTTTQRRSKNWLTYSLIMLAILVLCALGIFAYGARTALAAEENYQAFLHAKGATLEFLDQNDGRWPRSWDDLRRVQPDSDFEWVSKHVTFDFDATPIELATQTPDSFTAIKPNEPCFIFDDGIQQLIDKLKEHK